MLLSALCPWPPTTIARSGSECASPSDRGAGAIHANDCREHVRYAVAEWVEAASRRRLLKPCSGTSVKIERVEQRSAAVSPDIIIHIGDAAAEITEIGRARSG